MAYMIKEETIIEVNPKMFIILVHYGIFTHFNCFVEYIYRLYVCVFLFRSCTCTFDICGYVRLFMCVRARKINDSACF